jgi:5-methylcytosine-specific restriction endonuclease McrA
LAQHKYYTSTHWKALRAAALRRDRWHCVITGCGRGATIVDHIKTRPRQDEPSPEDRLDNLRSLCARHDAQIKEGRSGRRGRDGRPRIGCDEDGWPLAGPDVS